MYLNIKIKCKKKRHCIRCHKLPTKGMQPKGNRGMSAA